MFVESVVPNGAPPPDENAPCIPPAPPRCCFVVSEDKSPAPIIRTIELKGNKRLASAPHRDLIDPIGIFPEGRGVVKMFLTTNFRYIYFSKSLNMIMLAEVELEEVLEEL